jgi:hypothetical protein
MFFDTVLGYGLDDLGYDSSQGRESFVQTGSWAYQDSQYIGGGAEDIGAKKGGSNRME